MQSTTTPITHDHAPTPPTEPPTPPEPARPWLPDRAHFQSLYPDRKIQIDPEDPQSLRSIFFNPDLETSARVIQALLSPNNSLASIAYSHATTIEAVSAWMAKPDIAQRIHHLKHAAAVHHSLAATFQINHAIDALVIILREYEDDACHAEALKYRGGSPAQHIRHDRETARKAAHLLARLTHFDQTIRPPRNPREPRESITTPHTIPTSLPTTSGDTAKGFAHIEPEHADHRPFAATGFMQYPRGNAGATGAAPPTPDIDPTDLNDQSLRAEIQDLLARVDASRSAAHQPVPPVAGSEPGSVRSPQASINQPPRESNQPRQPVPDHPTPPIAESTPPDPSTLNAAPPPSPPMTPIGPMGPIPAPPPNKPKSNTPELT